MGYIGAGISRFNTADGLTVTGDATIDTTTLVVDSTNNRVGIKVSPERDLHVKGSSGDPVHFKLEGDASDYARIMFDDGTDDNIGEIRYDFGSDFMQFTVNAGEAFRVDSSKNLLIAKTASGYQNDGMEFNDSSNKLFLSNVNASCANFNRGGSTGSFVGFTQSGTTFGSIGSASSENFYISGHDNNGVGLLFNGDGERIQPCNSSGTGRDAAIDLGESAGRFKDSYFSGTVHCVQIRGVSDTNTGIDVTGSDIIAFKTGGSQRAEFSTGALRIGQSTTDHPGSGNTTTGIGLRTNGDAFFSDADSDAIYGNRNNAGGVVSIALSGTAKGGISVSSSAVAFNTTSDRRLKSNIQDAASASDKIDALQVRQFDWNVDGSHQDFGLVAQELQPIEPMAVSGDENSDEMMSVDYSKLVPMLIKEIQELRSRVATLEAS